jgi:hypothetical protein
LYTNRKSKRLVGAIAAFAAVATGLLAAGVDVASAAPLPPNTAPAGSVTVAPATGTAATSFGFTLPGGASCPGDGTAGYRWQTFIIPNAADASQLVFVGGSPSIGGSSTGIFPLFSSGNPIVDQNPALTTGAVTVAGTLFQLSVFPANTFTNGGIYKIGVACTDGLGVAQTYWQTKLALTVNAAGAITNYAIANPPAAPVLSAPTFATAGAFGGTVAVTASNPAITSVVLTATSSNGGVTGSTTITTLQTGSTTFSIPSLSNGKTYSVTAVAINAAGSSAASNAISGIVVDPNDRGPVQNVIATPKSGGADISWAAPAGGTPNNYTISVSPALAGFPVTQVGTTVSITNGAAGVAYTVTIQANFTAPATSPAVTTTFVAAANSLVTQTIDVNRPLGGLVLTQRCGVFGALPPEAATNAFPAFNAAAEIGTPVTALNGVATIPGLLVGGTAPTVPGGAADPNFNQYPYPVDANGIPTNPGAVTYPTNCGLSLGTAQLITTGTEAGKYFRASGRLNQVTVVDTRNADLGWTLQGSITDFSSTTSADTFSGNYLGWSPVRNFDSGPTLEGYDMTTAAGAVTQPDFLTGLKAAPKNLGTASANAGLGIAAFDARLRLLIPVTKDNGVYTAVLSISVF